MFNDLGVSDPAGKITCATCHDIHGGSETEKSAATEKDDPGRPNTILRKASPDICRECHADKFTIENSRHDLGVVFPKGYALIGQKVDHPDLCRYCHHVHSSEPQGFVWNKQITTPSGDIVDDMCTACHTVNGLAPEMTTGKNSHPVNMPLTGTARTTALPLFSGQGKVSPSGIMTCYTCHDPHRSTPSKSEASDQLLPGGKPTNHFLRIEVAPSSDLCLSCHGDKADVLQSDHNLLITAPDAKNALGRKPFESGVCGACHIVHNSTEKIDLWAMAPGTGSNVMEKMCNSCHNDRGAAAAKVPLVSSHPETLFVSVWEKNRENAQNFPFFDTKTGQVSPVGNISCPSCHDVHHWSAAPDGDRRGKKNVEGDAVTSFLRPGVAEEVCRQCHGPEGLFVFKYFHKPGLRRIN